MLITAKGIIIRTHIDEVSVIGRTGQGVRIMKTGAGEVVAVALAPYYAEEVETEAAEGDEDTAYEVDNDEVDTEVAEGADDDGTTDLD